MIDSLPLSLIEAVKKKLKKDKDKDKLPEPEQIIINPPVPDPYGPISMRNQ